MIAHSEPPGSGSDADAAGAVEGATHAAVAELRLHCTLRLGLLAASAAARVGTPQPQVRLKDREPRSPSAYSRHQGTR